MQPLIPVTNSSQITAWAYDGAQRVLSLVYRNSAFRYDYREVPPEVARDFEKAESKGGFVGKHIRGLYDFSRVDTSSEEAGGENDAEPLALKDGSKVDLRAPWPMPA